MNTLQRALAIVADYNRLYGAKCTATFSPGANPDWERLANIQEEMSVKLVDGIKLALDEASGALRSVDLDFEPADEPQSIIKEPPKNYKATFQSRPVPPFEELWELTSKPGATMNDLRKHFQSHPNTINKWLKQRGIQWASGAEPVKMG